MQHRGAYEVSAENTLMDVETGIWRKPVASPPLIDIGDFDINPTDIRDTTEIVISGVADVVRRGGIPVLLGGDHYVAYPGFAGFSKGMTERGGAPRLGYLHIDSHPDFRDVHGVGGKYTHGTQARRLSEDTHISYNNMAWVGLNGSVIDPAQHRIFRSGGMQVTTAKMIREQGPAEIVRSAMEVVGHSVDAVYVTIDIDVVDGSESPGTGAPIFTGITAVEFLEMMEALSSYDIIKAIDICEVAPPLDPTGRTVHLAASGLLGILGPHIFETVEID